MNNIHGGSFQLNLAFTSFAKKKPYITKLFKKYLIKMIFKTLAKSFEFNWYQYFHICWSRKKKRKLFFSKIHIYVRMQNSTVIATSTSLVKVDSV